MCTLVVGINRFILYNMMNDDTNEQLYNIILWYFKNEFKNNKVINCSGGLILTVGKQSHCQIVYTLYILLTAIYA